MERVLDVYKRPCDPLYPVVCMDESPKQLIAETREAIPASPGQPARYDYEYRRCGPCNIFLANEPLAGKRMVKITEHRTRQDWAIFLQDIAGQYPEAEKIILVMDNLNTHTPGSFYETYSPEKAKALWDRLEFLYTPKHGSWLNMAEIELSVLGRTIKNYIPEQQALCQEAQALISERNATDAKIDWRFRTPDARIKVKQLYPSISS